MLRPFRRWTASLRSPLRQQVWMISADRAALSAEARFPSPAQEGAPLPPWIAASGESADFLKHLFFRYTAGSPVPHAVFWIPSRRRPGFPEGPSTGTLSGEWKQGFPHAEAPPFFFHNPFSRRLIPAGKVSPPSRFAARGLYPFSRRTSRACPACCPVLLSLQMNFFQFRQQGVLVGRRASHRLSRALQMGLWFKMVKAPQTLEDLPGRGSPPSHGIDSQARAGSVISFDVLRRPFFFRGSKVHLFSSLVDVRGGYTLRISGRADLFPSSPETRMTLSFSGHLQLPPSELLADVHGLFL